MLERRFWINTVSLDHVEAARKAASRRPGDEMIFYSPRTSLQKGTPVQQFTAWATITGEQPYQVIVTADFRPWRLAATFHPSTPVDARSLVDQLSFIRDPTHWRLPFRRGLSTIPEDDFSRIRTWMRS